MLGNVIKEIRKRRGITQKELASMSGISQTYLSQIEADKKDANLATIKSLSKELGFELPVLFLFVIKKDDVLRKQLAFEKFEKHLKIFTDELF